MKIYGYAHRGDLAGLRQELELEINIDSINNQTDPNLGLPRMTPLQYALASPIAGVDMIEFLIDRGAKLGRLDFFLAVFAGKIEKIQFLLDLGVDINRYGQSMTHLPDGRIIAIAGEHESDCSPEFCIYNDVIVYDGQGDFQIYGYPADVFLPTDFHTATLVDNWIYIIGNLGYPSDRIVGTTPVYRLNCTTFAIEPIITTGECPGWIHRHRAVARVGGASPLENRQIHISGGQIWMGDDNFIDNPDEYIFNSKAYRWERVEV